MMFSTPSACIEADKDKVAKVVLMPGDPLRAKFIAETFLEEARLVNNVRGIGGYTGFYQGKRVSVMASGMGMPSMGIYSYELFRFYEVDHIIRIGTAGAIRADIKLRDVVAGMGACTNSSFAQQYQLPGDYAPIASYRMLKTAVDTAKQLGIDLIVGNLYSSDTFYDEREDGLLRWQKMGVLAIEMEAAALYMNAALTGKEALAICTISDCPLTGESSSSEERQTSFTQMMEIALQTAIRL